MKGRHGQRLVPRPRRLSGHFPGQRADHCRRAATGRRARAQWPDWHELSRHVYGHRWPLHDHRPGRWQRDRQRRERWLHVSPRGFTNPDDRWDRTIWTANFTATAVPKVTLAVTDADCVEGTNTGKITLTRTGSTASALTVNFLNSTGSATKGSDYTLAPDLVQATPYYTAVFPPGRLRSISSSPRSMTPARKARRTFGSSSLPGRGYILGGAHSGGHW